jgi:hypothetical protein
MVDSVESMMMHGLLLIIIIIMWLYNSFIEFWPSQPTPSIFLYLGQESSNMVLLTSVALF